ncbi:PhzF family phenazine biosynthesis protein [Bacillus sp. FJAT-49705]|uniref:PhzF family phenazine biosynthesis protein n=1 Tax=Cytobacillus citreus TaxID=2833586 RepID=A0ABS5NXK2_9BACI|nr:PhzF family phenazine biosynthesis protein [Cytobacillus citreus]
MLSNKCFSKNEFKGNPAAIVFLTEERSDEWMKSMAKELNQPITTFITEKDESCYHLRWFTTTKEIELCGHGTLGAAHILWSEGYAPSGSPITKQLVENGILNVISSTFYAIGNRKEGFI